MMKENTVPGLGYLSREIRCRLITDFIHVGDFPYHEHQTPVVSMDKMLGNQQRDLASDPCFGDTRFQS
jgi:hypothetical protein